MANVAAQTTAERIVAALVKRPRLLRAVQVELAKHSIAEPWKVDGDGDDVRYQQDRLLAWVTKHPSRELWFLVRTSSVLRQDESGFFSRDGRSFPSKEAAKQFVDELLVQRGFILLD